MFRARLVWLAVPLVGLVELGAHFYFAHRAPRVGDWAALREPVTRLRQHGELVIVAPHWAEPLAREALGDRLMPLADVARPDESAYASAVEVSILGQHAPELADWKPTNEEQVGKFELRVLANPAPAHVTFDFVDHLTPDRVEVSERAGGANLACPWRANAPVSNGSLGGNPTFPAQRFACSSGEWFFAGVTVIDDNHEFRPRRCIWAHPPPGGPLTIRYQAVPLGAVIRGYAGLPWLIFRDGVGTPVELEIRVDGKTIGTAVHEDRQGWAPWSFPTGRAGQTADVELEVRSASNKDRHFCFYADTR